MIPGGEWRTNDWGGSWNPPLLYYPLMLATAWRIVSGSGSVPG